MKTVVLEWNGVLGKAHSNVLYPGAVDLINNLLAQNVAVKIVLFGSLKPKLSDIPELTQLEKLNAIEYVEMEDEKISAIVQSANKQNKLLFVTYSGNRLQKLRAHAKEKNKESNVIALLFPGENKISPVDRQSFYNKINEQVKQNNNNKKTSTPESKNSERPKSFFQRYPLVKNALIGAAFGFGLCLLVGVTAGLILISGGTTAPIFLAGCLLVVKTLGVSGTIGVSLGVGLAFTKICAAFHALCGLITQKKPQKTTPEISSKFTPNATQSSTSMIGKNHRSLLLGQIPIKSSEVLRKQDGHRKSSPIDIPITKQEEIGQDPIPPAFRFSS